MFEFTEELEIIIEVHGFTPSRPAPLCDNPSDFNFADPGDDADWQEVKFYYLVDNKKVEITDKLFCEYLESIHRDNIIEKGENEN